MQQVIDLFEAHGVLSVFLAVLLEQLGAPVPALPFLVLAGATGASNALFAAQSLAAAAVASVAADATWFLAGRRYGRSVLGVLCRISISPATCVQKSELSFARRGALTLLFAKFVPGVSTLAPPLAGATGMRLRTFVLIDLAGTLLWAGAGMAAGVVFHDRVRRAVQSLEALGNAAVAVIGGMLVAYVAWRSVRRLLVQRTLRRTPKIAPGVLARLMESGERVVLLDVRAAPRERSTTISGAVPAPLEDGDVLERIAAAAGEAMLVTYCDCPHDASAARAAARLAAHGYRSHVLAGGLPAWEAAGLPVAAGAATVDAPVSRRHRHWCRNRFAAFQPRALIPSRARATVSAWRRTFRSTPAIQNASAGAATGIAPRSR